MVTPNPAEEHAAKAQAAYVESHRRWAEIIGRTLSPMGRGASLTGRKGAA